MIRWTYAFADRPSMSAATAFWTAVTGTRLSPPRGERGEFVTLLPPHGDPYLKAQQVSAGPGGAHLDLCVPDVAGFLPLAAAAGAQPVARRDDWAVLRSPGGLAFCVVSWQGEAARPGPGPAGSRVDQVCVDVGPAGFDAEVRFWAAVTGWADEPGGLPEFRLVRPPAGLPLRILVQRLGTDRPIGAHLDLACADPAAVAARHEQLGAQPVRRQSSWLVMRDPAGGLYCLTGRDPQTGD